MPAPISTTDTRTRPPQPAHHDSPITNATKGITYRELEGSDGSLKAETYGLAGVKATGGGQNTLEGRGNATVTVNSYNGEGMLADGGSNTVSAQDGKITVLGRSGAGVRAASQAA